MKKSYNNGLGMPRRQGLYDPNNEHDACGVGLVVNIKGKKSHDIVENGLQVLEHMMHRGAEGADNKTGDGAGIMVQIPHEFILLQGIPVPEKGHYGTGLVFLPRDLADQTTALGIIKRNVQTAGLNLMYVRDVPVNNEVIGEAARNTEPVIKQLFITGDPGNMTLEQKLYVVRKKIEKEVAQSDMSDKDSFYVVSLSCRTLVYKGMLSSVQLRYYFPDLINPYFTSGLALVHSRFSTNTFPTWSLAQPFRMLGHNGEINTIRGNRSWMESRESVLHPDELGPIEELRPGKLQRQKPDLFGAEIVLRVPQYLYGAVGRTRNVALFRWTLCGRYARPERFASGPLLYYDRRYDGRCFRNRNPCSRVFRNPRERAVASRKDFDDRYRKGRDSIRSGDQGASGFGASL